MSPPHFHNTSCPPSCPPSTHPSHALYIQGLVRVRRNQQWDYIAEDAFFASSAIRCISFDDSGYAWIGDEAGRVEANPKVTVKTREARLEERTRNKHGFETN